MRNSYRYGATLNSGGVTLRKENSQTVVKVISATD